jgi:hypothetical protein
MATLPPDREQRMIIAGQGIVVPVEDRQHEGYSVTGTGRSTAGSPSMLAAFFSRW